MGTNQTDVKDIPVYRVNASQRWSPLDLREIWDHRELLYFLVWRDVIVRYKQTLIGVAWAIIQPVMTMLVFSVFFGGVLKVPSNGIPYPVFSYAALVPWTFFASAIGQASDSLVGNSYLIKKVYFPRLIMPIARILSGGVDFALSFLVLIVMMVLFGLFPRVEALVVIPFLLAIMLLTSLGVSLWLSSLNVRYRDIRYIVPFLVQIWMYITPIVYSSSMISEPMRTLYSLNPMTGVIEGFRWALVGGANFSISMLATSSFVAVIISCTGLIFFQRAEGTFADVV